ncbi:PREDICTED: uncharacterized protein LOC104815221 [Tarenaya hassleriana]|uniref:uncharacterized protein LOC104815221 n=1 Tax=Tarenaya hassleriana TaxID=28532 RepID=UPI00053C5FE4|nr:PREDICTED: uncharacterized protein LOC104815221 [Tarenaya hassleriana]
MAATEEAKDVGRKTMESEAVSEGQERGNEPQTMAPWEQHASVISIPRFDYTAPSSLLHRSHSGFLVTCTIKREKSATKEVMSILGKYVGSKNEAKSEVHRYSDENTAPKRQKFCAEEIDGEGKAVIPTNDSSEESGENSRKEGLEINLLMSLVKLTRSGLLLLTLSDESSPDTTEIVTTIFQSLESGALKSPVWCHRIFPVQATCGLAEKELQETVSKLVRRFLNDKSFKLSNPLKFAAGYNRRGMEEMGRKVSKDSSEGREQIPVLDRGKCFEAVAAGVKEIVPDSIVDLNSPELCVLVELLPVSGIRSGSFIAAVSVLPQNLVTTKPKLCIKPLVPGTKQTGKTQ